MTAPGDTLDPKGANPDQTHLDGRKDCRPRLGEIPLDVLKEISQYLDRRSALNLALTCKSLREAGEMKLWEAVDVTFDIRLSELIAAPPTHLHPTGPHRIHTPDAERQRVVAIEARRVASALRSHPSRKDYRTTGFLEPHDESETDDLVFIVSSIQARLRSLVIVPPFPDVFLPGDPNDKPPRSGFFPSLVGAKIAFPKLVDLRWCFRARDVGYIRHILNSCKGIEVLQMNQVSEAIDCDKIPKYPVLENVTRLTYEGSDPSSGPNLLAGVLKATPNVEWCETMGLTRLEKDSVVVKAMKGCKALKKVLHGWGEAKGLWEGKGFEGLEELSVAAHDEEEIGEMSLQLQGQKAAFKLPRMPQLKGIHVLSLARPPMAEYASLGVEYVPPARRISQHVGPHFIRRLRVAKSLVEVHHHPTGRDGMYGAMERRPWNFDANKILDKMTLYDEFTEFDAYGWPVSAYPVERWEETGYRGITIRSYINEATGLDFVHMRALTRVRPDMRETSYLGGRRRWQEITRYRGRTIPYAKVQAAYEIDGIDLDWIKGQRALTLSDEAWAVLDEWVNWANENGIDGEFDTSDNDDFAVGVTDDAEEFTDDEDGFEGSEGDHGEWTDLDDDDDEDGGMFHHEYNVNSDGELTDTEWFHDLEEGEE